MSSVRRSVVLVLVENHFSMIISFAMAVIVARLLTPHEVGVYAIAAIFSSVASQVRDFGVSEYLIQSKELTTAKLRASLTMNLVVSWSMAALLWVVADPVARFYQEPGVRECILILGFNFVFIPFGAVTIAWLRRELEFRPILIASLVSNLGASVVTIVLAYLGWSYTSLAVGTLVGVVLTVVVTLFYRPRWFPRWPGREGLGEAASFGLHVCGVYVFKDVGRSAPTAILGRVVDATAVGLFSRAQGLLEIFSRSVLAALQRVGLPYYSRVLREQGDLSALFWRAAQLTVGTGWPFCAMVVIVGAEVIEVLYGPNWLGAAPLLTMLSLAFAVEIVFVTSKEILIARGLPKVANTLQVVEQGIRVAAMLAGGIAGGLQGLLVGYLAGMTVGSLVAAGFLRRHGGIHLRYGPRALGPSLLVTGLVAAAALGAREAAAAVTQSAFLTLLIVGPAGLAAWLVGLRLVRHPLLDELLTGLRALRARPAA